MYNKWGYQFFSPGLLRIFVRQAQFPATIGYSARDAVTTFAVGEYKDDEMNDLGWTRERLKRAEKQTITSLLDYI